MKKGDMREKRLEEYPLEEQLIFSGMNAFRLGQAMSTRRLSDTGIYRSQHQTLVYLAKHPEVSQREIAAVFSVSTATMAVTLKKLEAAGYIERSVSRTDNRQNCVRLTEKGLAVIEESAAVFREIQREMFAGFTEEEKRRMLKDFQRLAENLERLQEEET